MWWIFFPGHLAYWSVGSSEALSQNKKKYIFWSILCLPIVHTAELQNFLEKQKHPGSLWREREKHSLLNWSALGNCDGSEIAIRSHSSPFCVFAPLLQKYSYLLILFSCWLLTFLFLTVLVSLPFYPPQVITSSDKTSTFVFRECTPRPPCPYLSCCIPILGHSIAYFPGQRPECHFWRHLPSYQILEQFKLERPQT